MVMTSVRWMESDALRVSRRVVAVLHTRSLPHHDYSTSFRDIGRRDRPQISPQQFPRFHMLQGMTVCAALNAGRGALRRHGSLWIQFE
jgi:hypothetical protein